ncbi:MAG: DEAD/DEAH box helicase [Candidatus Nanopelagicales bacterium]
MGAPHVEEVASRLAGDPRAVHVIHLAPRTGSTTPWPEWLDPLVRMALTRTGISEPWRHQVRAADLAWAGQHVVVATGTASGKSLAFGMPGLTAALQEPAPGATRGPSVLYLSPTKALAHDQLAGLRALDLPGLRAASVDGDTPDEEREWARSHARWLVTNPDMLHRSILPAHERWHGFLRSLRFVVIDEAHVYRGVFGSQVALVLRRLRRVAALHGADPTFIAASATAADPGPSISRLVGVDICVIDSDDSAHGPAELVLWQPDGVSSGELVRSTVAEAADIMAGLIDAGQSTLTFARSRRGAEGVASAVRQNAEAGARVRAYRGGYLPEERRHLEADLRSGKLLGLAATSALELGIDISGLDAVVMAGWPGTTASFWQQAGRAGRRGAPALIVLVAREDPLDQYLVNHPDVLTGRPPEQCVIDPDNDYVLAGHLCAAAAEAPLIDGRIEPFFGAAAEAMCQALAARGLLRRRRDGWYWTSQSRAADLVDLRGAAGGPVRIVEEGTGRLLGTVDPATAPAVVHPGAIYVHQGSTFEIGGLDLGARVATAAATTTDLSTHARTRSEVTFESVRNSARWGSAEVLTGHVQVTSQVTSFLVRRWPSGQVVAEHPLDLPPACLPTAATWWSIPEEALVDAEIDEAQAPGAVHALEHSMIGILPLFATCDRWDVGGLSTAHHPQTGQAAIVIHDGHPGGAGFAERGYLRATEWMRATNEVIAGCPCVDGCPRCVQSPKCGNGNRPLDKASALRLARALLAMSG